MPIPDITHLQFLLLAGLVDGERPGRELRGLMKQEEHRVSGPAFYRLMGRMEDADIVEGRYEQKLVEGQIFKERVYKITGGGVSAFERARDFYAAVAARRR